MLHTALSEVIQPCAALKWLNLHGTQIENHRNNDQAQILLNRCTYFLKPSWHGAMPTKFWIVGRRRRNLVLEHANAHGSVSSIMPFRTPFPRAKQIVIIIRSRSKLKTTAGPTSLWAYCWFGGVGVGVSIVGSYPKPKTSRPKNCSAIPGFLPSWFRH